MSVAEKPVACGDHSAVTAKVIDIPDHKAEQAAPYILGSKAPDGAGPLSDLLRKCGPQRMARVVPSFLRVKKGLLPDGVQAAGRAASVIQIGLFPTAEQWRAGGRWMRCDWVPEPAESSANAPTLDWSPEEVGPRAIPRELVYCFPPKAPLGEKTVDCTKPGKKYEAVFEMKIEEDLLLEQSQQKKLPDWLFNEARTKCQDLVTGVLPGVDRQRVFAFGYEGLQSNLMQVPEDQPLQALASKAPYGLVNCVVKTTEPVTEPLGTQ